MKTARRLTITSLMLTAFNLSAATLHVSLESTNPVTPFSTWATAATNIQEAVDAAKAGDTVLVTNGVYAVGAKMAIDGGPSSRVVVTNSITLQSVNGPLVTTIQGEGLRCVQLKAAAVLSGFTLTNGVGGVSCEASSVVTNCTLTGNLGSGASGGTLYHCVLTGNRSVNGAGATGSTLYNCILSGNALIAAAGIGDGRGGGAWQCTLYNCTLRGNSAFRGGGGAYASTLYNCLLTDNWAGWGGGACACSLYNCTLTGNAAIGYPDSSNAAGGGASGGRLYNCIVYYNTAPIGANYLNGPNPDFAGSEISTFLDYSCTTPLPTNGIGNITGLPLFTDLTTGDFRLREGSPCIDAGTNLVGLAIVPFVNPDTWATSLMPYTYEPTDILGNTRLFDGNGDGKAAWDMGAYEFHSFNPPRLIILPQQTPDGYWRFTITGTPMKVVRLQRSWNLKDSWENSGQAEVLGKDGACEITDYSVQFEHMMFYRVVVQ